MKKRTVRRFINDVALNSIAFAIYIGGQQIILLPVMARELDSTAFSLLVIFISIFSIITNSIGSELGIIRQIKNESDYKKKVDTDCYNRMLLYMLPIIVIPTVATLGIYGYSLVYVLFFSIIVVMGNIRLYLLGFFRLKKEFKQVVFQNLFYVVGSFFGLLMFVYFKTLFLPFLFGELFAIFYSINKTDFFRRRKFCIKQIKSDIELLGKSFFDFVAMSFTSNFIAYFDKLIIYPILGSASVSIYYAANSMGKAVTLITNPIYGVVISWLGALDSKNKKNIIMTAIKANIPMILIVGILNWPITYIALKILYPQYFQEAMEIVWIICAVVGISVACNFIKGILLKFYNSRAILMCYISYFLIFILLSFPLSYLYGLKGFVLAKLIASIEQWIVFIFLLYKCNSIEK